MNTRLYRSRSDVMIAGVCGGLGEYLGIDTTLVRLFFVLLGVGSSGIGFMVYLLLWVILPVQGQPRDTSLGDTVRSGSEEVAERARAMGDDFRQMVREPHPRAGLLVGSALILMGAVFLVQNLRLPWLYWLDFDIAWPILLIIGGAALLVRHARGE